MTALSVDTTTNDHTYTWADIIPALRHHDSPRVANLRKIAQKLEDYWQELSIALNSDVIAEGHTNTCVELIAVSRLMNECDVRIAEIEHAEVMAEQREVDAHDDGVNYRRDTETDLR